MDTLIESSAEGGWVPSKNHEAAGSALGYLYQTSWALLELLRRKRSDSMLTLEMHDDVSWDVDGTATELIQVKHHIAVKGGLGDMSVDLWRTLNAWMDDGSPSDPYGPILTLVTTSIAAAGSAASLLRDDTNRDPDHALSLLEKAASTSESGETEPWRAKFRKLTQSERRTFVSRIYVADGSYRIEDVESALREVLWLALPSGEGAQAAFMSLLMRWWNNVSIDLLRKKRSGVSRDQLQEAITSIRNNFSESSLPTLVELEDVDEEQAVGLHGDRVFVHQLKWIRVQTDNLRTAIVDYHRAVTQETEWLDKDLVDIHELREFEARLVDEWRRVFSDMLEDLPPDADEQTKARSGRELFRYLRDSTLVVLRAQYQDAFFGRGKRHELADRRELGWHPEFEERLAALVGV